MSISRLMQMGAAGGGGEPVGWIALANGNVAYDVAVDSSDNIFVAGEASISGTAEALIVKYNSLGAIDWARSLGGSSSDTALGVTVDSNDNVIINGRTLSDGAGSFDLLIAKYNSSGVLQWDRTLGGSGNDQGFGVAVDSLDNIIVCGRTESDGAGQSDLLLAKYNSSGVLQWDKTLGGATQDDGRGVAVDSADNIIVSGFTTSDGAGSLDLLLAKYNSSGTLLWDRTLGGSGNEGTADRGVAVDSSDNIILYGHTASDGAGGQDLLIAKYNSSGVLQWDRTLGGSGTEFSQGVTVDSLNNIIVCGFTDSDGAGGYDLLIAKYNSSGVLQWDRTLGGSGSQDWGYGVAVDSLDNIIVCGKQNSDGFGWITTKLPPDGSGTGTYGPFTYEEAVLTDAEAVLTDAPAVLTDAAAVLTDAEAVLTDAPAVLTEELIEITP